jgi:hypothetical protein
MFFPTFQPRLEIYQICETLCSVRNTISCTKWLFGFQYFILTVMSLVFSTSTGWHIYNSFSIWTPIGRIILSSILQLVKWIQVVPTLVCQKSCNHGSIKEQSGWPIWQPCETLLKLKKIKICLLKAIEFNLFLDMKWMLLIYIEINVF